MDSALRVGLAALVDYAGLFPPAALPLPEVVERFARYVASNERWMLGRLIVPFAQLDALDAAIERRPAGRAAWSVSVLLAPDAVADEVEPRLAAFGDRHAARGVSVGSVEVAPASIADVARVPAQGTPGIERFVEVPLGPGAGAWLDAVARAGCSAKIRTGGLSEDRFPSAAEVAAFLRETVARDLAFKATAGLHHPLRNRYRLTYEPESPAGRMHGFVNLVLAASVALREHDAKAPLLESLLEESDPRAFTVTSASVRWGDVELTATDIADGRRRALRSVGSCSFEEPVDDLRALGWLPTESR